jgi:hypothetical protein
MRGGVALSEPQAALFCSLNARANRPTQANRKVLRRPIAKVFISGTVIQCTADNNRVHVSYRVIVGFEAAAPPTAQKTQFC